MMQNDKDPLSEYRDRRYRMCSVCEHRNTPALQKNEICRNCVVRDRFNVALKIEPEENF
jgi:ribosomal protein S14